MRASEFLALKPRDRVARIGATSPWDVIHVTDDALYLRNAFLKCEAAVPWLVAKRQWKVLPHSTPNPPPRVRH